jgi:hypothetical protein
MFWKKQKRRYRAREVLGNHRWQSQQSRLELGLCLKPWTATGERSGLLMHVGTTVNASLFARMKD